MRDRVLGGPAVLVGVLAMLTAGAGLAVAAPAPASTQPSVVATNVCQSPIDRVAPPVPWTGPTVATGLRVGQHETVAPTYDRIVVDLTKPLADYRVRYVPQLIGDASGLPIPLRGRAFLEVRLKAISHDTQGHSTVLVRNRVVNWGTLLQAQLVTDYEGQLQFGIGLRSKVDFVVSALTSPNRLVIDVAMPGQHPWVCTSGAVKVFFQNKPNYVKGVEPYVTPVWRRVATPAVAAGALNAMFHWPTPSESAAGLRFVNSAASTFDRLSIVNSVARVRLLWACNSYGSTFTIANEIMPTLKQFSSVQWVKLYDPAGSTETPNGLSDSIPFCLEP